MLLLNVSETVSIKSLRMMSINCMIMLSSVHEIFSKFQGPTQPERTSHVQYTMTGALAFLYAFQARLYIKETLYHILGPQYDGENCHFSRNEKPSFNLTHNLHSSILTFQVLDGFQGLTPPVTIFSSYREYMYISSKNWW